MNGQEQKSAAGERRGGVSWWAIAAFAALNGLYLTLDPWWALLIVPLGYWCVAHFGEHRQLSELRGGLRGVAEFACGMGWAFTVEIIASIPVDNTQLDIGMLNAGVLGGLVFYAACEELLWRGLLLRWLVPRVGMLLGLALSSFGFAVVHGNLSPLALLIYFVDGALFGAAFLVTRRLWLSVGLHVGMNLASVLTAQGEIWLLPYVGLEALAAAAMLVGAYRRNRAEGTAVEPTERWARRQTVSMTSPREMQRAGDDDARAELETHDVAAQSR